MTNAWSLLYDTMNHSEHYYEYDRNDPNRKGPEVYADGYSVRIGMGTAPDYEKFWNEELKENTNDGPVGSSGEDRIEFKYKIPDLPEAPDNSNGRWKYNEDVILKEVREYLGATYRSHYTSQESKTQTLDLIEGIGDAEPFCRSNAIKYLSRFGKKEGKSKQDILKAIHYCILLYHFAGLCNENTSPYETF